MQLLLYRNGWPARLSHRFCVRTVPRIAHHAIELDGSAPQTPSLTLAFASDFHAGVTTDPGVLRHACAMLEAADADLLLLGGDFVSLDARQIEWLAPLLGRIPARLGRFAVLGNHDYWNGADQVVRSLERAGIELLTNRNEGSRLHSTISGSAGSLIFSAATPTPSRHSRERMEAASC